MQLNIDRTKWKKVKLGDVAFEYSKRINNPRDSEFEKFVGSSNIGQWDFRIKSWESTSSVTSAMKLFEPNDYLLVRRSLYASDFRERAPRADFYGVCSGDILTIKENKELIADGFLIGIFNSPALWKYIVANGSGSITRRIHWKDLANYEFLLPPKAEQARLAELLWAMDDVIEKEKDVLEKLDSSYEIFINKTMIHGNFNDDGRIIITKCGLLDSRIEPMLLKDCLLQKPNYGANASSKAYEKDTPRYIRITDIDDEGNLINEEVVSIDSEDYQNYILKHNDFLFARTGNTVGKTLLYDSQMGESVYAGYLIRFRLNQKVLLPKFLFYFTKSLKYDSFKRKMIKVGAQPNINAEEYQLMLLPKLPIEVQLDIVEKLDSMKSRNNLIKSKISASQSLQKSLINQIF